MTASATFKCPRPALLNGLQRNVGEHSVLEILGYLDVATWHMQPSVVVVLRLPKKNWWKLPMKKSRILTEVNQTARGLNRIGMLDQQTMREFDVLTVPPVRALSARQIRAIRARTRMSQAVCAAVLNTSTSTVQKWGIGAKRPSGPSLKLLNVINTKGVDALS